MIRQIKKSGNGEGCWMSETFSSSSAEEEGRYFEASSAHEKTEWGMPMHLPVLP